MIRSSRIEIVNSVDNVVIKDMDYMFGTRILIENNGLVRNV